MNTKPSDKLDQILSVNLGNKENKSNFHGLDLSTDGS